jgi:hypothetical protein
MDPNVAAALHALDGTGLPWLLLRGEHDLARPSGDVDILVARELLPVLDRVLEAAGFRRVLAPGHGSHRFYFCYSAAADAWVKLDIVSEIAFGSYQQRRTSLARLCLGRRVPSGPLWLPAPPDQAWLQLLHLFLDKGRIAPSRREAARIAAAAASADDSIAEFVDRRMGPGTAANVLELVRAGRFDDVPATAAAMTSKWAGGPAVPWLIAARHRGLRLLGARLPDRGTVVGVMAPDGAGKTTLLRGLQAAVPLPTKYVYMGMWGAGPWDSWLVKFPGGRSAKKVYRVVRGGLLARSWSLLGRLVLMDRVPYDVLLPGAVHGPGGAGNSAMDSIMEKATNAVAFTVVRPPDLLLVLDVPGQVMFDRKGEHSPEILEGWRLAYRNLAEQLPGSNVIDATQAPERVLSESTGLVWRRIAPAVGAGQGPGAGPGPEADALSLHLWRLLDWRFLLPDLEARSVAYGGATAPDMASALHLLDPAAAALPPDERGDHGGTYGVVLLTAPDRAAFRSASAAVEPGGWMCVEARRSLFQRTGPRTLKGWKNVLIRSGYQDVSVFWNAPSLNRTARIVPAASAAGIRDTLALHKDVRFGGAKALAARLALILGLFDLAVPEGTVTGRRPPEEPQ